MSNYAKIIRKGACFSCFAFKITNFAQILENFAQTCVCTSSTFRSSEYEVIECFEKDPIWGLMMLIFTFYLPGCAGEEWKKFTFRLTAAEGSFDSKTPFLLQLFIVFTRADRQPSPVQMASMATSLLMIIKTETQSFLKDQPAMAMEDHFKKAASVVPMILTWQISFLGSLADSAAIFRYLIAPIWILVTILTKIIAHISSNINLREPRPDTTFLQIVTNEKKMKWFVSSNFSNVFTWLLVLTGLTITANFLPDALLGIELLTKKILPAMAPWIARDGNIAIIQDIYLLNTIYITVMISGVIFTVLVCVHIILPCNEHVENQKNEKNDNFDGKEDFEIPLLIHGSEASEQVDQGEVTSAMGEPCIGSCQIIQR